MTIDSEKNCIPILIPAYEPDDRLITLLETIPLEENFLVLVDDGSGENYNEIFEKATEMIGKNGHVIRYDVNQGKGYALKTGFSWMIENLPKLVGTVTADSDGQHSIASITDVANKLAQCPDSLIMGCRQFKLDNVPLLSRLGNIPMITLMRYLGGVKVSDTQTGLRGIPAAFMKQLLDVKNNRFGFETEMLIQTSGNFPIEEVPIETIYDSKENHQTHYKPFKDSVVIIGILMRRFIKYLFSSLSSSAIDLGLFTLFCHMFKGSGSIWYITEATVLARVISAIYNYFINYKLVFNSKASKLESAVKYIGLVLCVMVASSAFTTLGVKLIPALPETVVKVVVDVFLFLINYKVQQAFVYKSKNVK